LLSFFSPEPSKPAPFERLVRRARGVLLIERIWPFVVGFGMLASGFLALSFTGVWLVLPVMGREIGVAIFVVAALALTYRATQLRWPARSEAVRRLDAEAPGALSIAAAYEDRAVLGDVRSNALWAEHRRRLAQKLKLLRPPQPKSDLARRDPFALRAAIVLALAGTAIVAGDERELRLRAAFDFKVPAQAVAAARLDGWINPPLYTQKAPVLFLNHGAAAKSHEFEVPLGSTVRLSGGGLEQTTIFADPVFEAQVSSAAERAFKLTGNGNLRLNGENFSFRAIADLPPVIALKGQPEAGLGGHLTLAYSIDDDYGASSAQARFLPGPEIGSAHVLEPPPRADLKLPPNGLGEAQSELDLTESAWAGAQMQMVLAAKDEGGNVGNSAPIEVTLPEKPLRSPLARALMEQRRLLVTQPDLKRADVRLALDGVLIAPNQFELPESVYLGLRVTGQRLRKARNDSDLLDVAQMLHDIALDLENRGHSPAEQRLKDAQQALRDAIARGASPQELEQLSKNLREALADVMREMAQRPPQARQGDQTRMISPNELKNMLDQLEALSKSGDLAGMMALLDQLQQFTQNMQSVEGDGKSPTEQALNGLDSLMQEQQGLRDKTYKPPQAGENSEDLRQKQSDLRRKLEELQKGLQDSGAPDEPGLSAAEEAMRRAESALGAKGERSGAVEAQGQALEAMRKAGQNLAKNGENGQGQNGKSAKGDPLGRNGKGSQFDRSLTPGATQADAARRVQEIFKEIQRRAGELQRPLPERDYLDRLLRNF